MMPFCTYKQCKEVADRKLGIINTGKKYLKNSDRTWEETVYVCQKHYDKLLNLLNMKPTEGEEATS